MKDCVPFQFSISLLHDLLLLFFPQHMMEDTALPLAKLESNIEAESKTLDSTFSIPQQRKRIKEDWKGVHRFDTKARIVHKLQDGGPFAGCIL